MFDPKEFIGVCRGLCQPGRSEAEYRTAVSRALYGVFLWAREELDARGCHVKADTYKEKPFEHDRVRSSFKTGKFRHDGVSSRLGGLYKLRYGSDYDLDVTINQGDVTQALEYVNYIQDAFEKGLFGAPPTTS
jgi:hypothetical protein